MLHHDEAHAAAERNAEIAAGGFHSNSDSR
jgi:hypothetical protein